MLNHVEKHSLRWVDPVGKEVWKKMLSPIDDVLHRKRSLFTTFASIVFDLSRTLMSFRFQGIPKWACQIQSSASTISSRATVGVFCFLTNCPAKAKGQFLHL